MAADMGGSYINRGNGEPKLVQATADHPEGNCARDADGTPINRPDNVTPKPIFGSDTIDGAAS